LHTEFILSEFEIKAAVLRCAAPPRFGLVNKRHVAHRVRFRLGVHHHPMPVRQRDRCVVRI
jgi:hypothetical protein